MFVIQSDAQPELRDQQRAHCNRVCATLFLILSTLFIVRLQQTRYDHAKANHARKHHQVRPRTSSPGSWGTDWPGKGGIATQSEAVEVLSEFSLRDVIKVPAYRNSVISLAYLDGSYPVPFLFTGTPSGLNMVSLPGKLLLSSSGGWLGMTWLGAPQVDSNWIVVKSDLNLSAAAAAAAAAPAAPAGSNNSTTTGSSNSTSTTTELFNNSTSTSNPRGEIIAQLLDTQVYKTVPLPGCPSPYAPFRCHITMVKLPLSECVHSPSWTCRGRTTDDYYYSEHDDRSTPSLNIYCVKVITGASLDSVYQYIDSNDVQSRIKKDAGEVLSFCGNPVNNLLVSDPDLHRLYFLQPVWHLGKKTGEEGVSSSSSPRRRNLFPTLRRLSFSMPAFHKVSPLWDLSDRASKQLDKNKPTEQSKARSRKDNNDNDDDNNDNDNDDDDDDDDDVTDNDNSPKYEYTYCLAEVLFKNEAAGNVGQCKMIAQPPGESTTPLFLYSDPLTKHLALFSFDADKSMYASIIKGPTKRLLGSVKYEHFKSGWILKSQSSRSSTIMIMGSSSTTVK